MTPQYNTKWYSLSGIWFGGIVSVPALLVGSTLIHSLSFSNALWAGFIGFNIVVLFMSLLSVSAVIHRKSTVSLASSSFGSKGAAVIVGLVIGISTLGWFGIQTNIAGASFAKILLEINGIHIPVWLSSICWGILMVITAVFGFTYVKWLNYIAVPAIIILLAYAMYITFQNHSWEDILCFQPTEKMSLLQAIGFTIGFISVGGVISADYNRFAASKKDAILGSILGIVPSAMCLLAIGGILAITQETYDIVTIFSSLGFPFLAMSILILATWTSNVMNIYSSGLAFNNLFQLSDKNRSKTTLIIGGIGIGLAAAGVLSQFMNFITFLTITITPIAGVMISDFYLSKTYTETPAKINWNGIISWLIGVTVMIFMDSEIKNILGILIAMLSYFILQKTIKNETNK
ncbi:cytosine permease [Tenacibaculum sp. nBUS_03]|uniref:cytosine permease n=1 Tax=Tenacibaculum sp. nBUS_03 TaxID=3395320 RepID=UPI003EB77C5D